jgi:peptidyl-prolyl cis-trans isomerase D
MSFEVFRRHQRKLLAIFAMLAMFGFVVSDSLPKLLSSNYVGRDQRVVTLYGKTIYQSDLNEMAQQRTNANQFISWLSPYQAYFGGLRTRDLVDALILQHEADRLGMPAGPELGREFLKEFLRQNTGRQMSRDLFEGVLSRFNNRVSGEQVLADIANQVRLGRVRELVGLPMVSPYDVFRAYRDEKERISAQLVEIPVAKYLAQVSEPSQEELRAYYEKYKDELPDAARETPGFKVPRQVRVEILSIDGNALGRSMKDRLSEAELRAAYENRKSEFEEHSELPKDLFAGQPELTPPFIKPFSEVRSTLAFSLAEDKAQAEIADKFTRIKDKVFYPFYDKYATALEEIEEAGKHGTKTRATLPVPGDLKDLAKREDLNYEVTPLLSREQAQRYGQISEAEVGMTRLSGGRKFADEFFDPKKSLYEPEELTDLLGTRYLARKVEDNPPHVPPLDQVRSEVVLAWKMARARPLAQQAADRLAERLKKKGGMIKDPTVDGFRVVTVPPIARRQTTLRPGRFDFGQPEDSPVPEVAHVGEAFRNAYFGLQTGSVAVASNRPGTVFYVMLPERREPATFAALYAPNGDEFRYKLLAREQAGRQLDDQWMGWLRQQAGVKPDWMPADESKNASSGRRG